MFVESQWGGGGGRWALKSRYPTKRHAHPAAREGETLEAFLEKKATEKGGRPESQKGIHVRIAQGHTQSVFSEN